MTPKLQQYPSLNSRHNWTRVRVFLEYHGSGLRGLKWVETRGENKILGEWDTRERERIPKKRNSSIDAFSAVSWAEILLWQEKKKWHYMKWRSDACTVEKSFKVNGPYNSATKILVPSQQTRVSHWELEALFAVVPCMSDNCLISWMCEAACLLCEGFW